MLEQKHETTRNIILLSVITLITFLPCIWNGFTTWEDPSYVTKNALIQSLSWSNIVKIFTTFTMGSYAPLTVLSFAVEFHFFKLNPVIYHLDNIFLHTLVSILVYQMIRRIDGRSKIALITALLFAVNPLRVESVAWVAERKDLLFSFFYLAAMITHIKKIESSKKIYSWWSFLFFLCSLLSKPQALSLPFTLLALDYFFRKKIEKSDLLNKIPFFILMFLFISISINGLSQIIPHHTLSGIYSPFEKLLLMSYAIFLYLKLSVYPTMVSFFYPYPDKIKALFPIYVYISLLFNILMLYSWLKFSRNNRHIFLAGLMFIITLLLPLTNIWLDGYFISERYMYLPSIWLFYGGIRALEKIKLNPTVRSSYVPIVSIIAIVFCATLSFGKCFIWKNDISLWGNVINTFPHSATGYIIRGDKFRELALTDLAFKDINQAIALDPHSFDAYYTRALLYMENNQLSLAIADFNQALLIKPANNNAEIFRDICYKKL